MKDKIQGVPLFHGYACWKKPNLNVFTVQIFKERKKPILQMIKHWWMDVHHPQWQMRPIFLHFRGTLTMKINQMINKWVDVTVSITMIFLISFDTPFYSLFQSVCFLSMSLYFSSLKQLLNDLLKEAFTA